MEDIEIEGEVVREAKWVKYLGCMFAKDRDKNKMEITERIVKYSRCVCALYPVLKDTYIPIEAKREIFNSVMVPILSYASESWTMTRRDWSRVQAAEMRPLRAMVGKTRRDRVRNEDIRREVGVTSVRAKIDKSQLRWLEHQERMDEDRIAKKRLMWTPDGRRSRGRPRKRWRDGVEEIIESSGLGTIDELRNDDAFERQNWRQVLTHLTG